MLLFVPVRFHFVSFVNAFEPVRFGFVSFVVVSFFVIHSFVTQMRLLRV